MTPLDAAIRYATEWDWPAFFVTASKRPFAGSHGFLDASLDPVELADLWRPDGHVALAVPDGFVVVDVDPGADTSHLLLPPTREQHTPRHGRHLVYLTKQPVPPGTSVRLHVDVRGPGSYIVAEPTPGYWWVNDRPIARAPEWLYERTPVASPTESRFEIEGEPVIVRRRVIRDRWQATISTF